MTKEIICTICPRGCRIEAVGDGKAMTSASGYNCKRGLEYATTEYSAPVRILTTTVKMDGCESDLLPVRSNSPVPKEKLFECMEIIRNTSVKLPVKRYDIIVENICGTGIDIVATKSVD